MTKLNIDKDLKALENHDQPFIELFTHGTLSIEFYKPAQLDHQSPHILAMKFMLSLKAPAILFMALLASTLKAAMCFLYREA